MARTACCNIIEFPVQVLTRRMPHLRDSACIVLAHEALQAPVIGYSAKAFELGVRHGMRYSAVLEFAPHVQAATVSQAELAQAQHQVQAALQSLSDEVLHNRDEPGVFWVNAGGLNLLYATARAFAEQLGGEISRLGFQARVGVGFTRFGTYLATVNVTESLQEDANGSHGHSGSRGHSAHAAEGAGGAFTGESSATVFHSIEHERREVSRCALQPVLRSERAGKRLRRLGIVTVGELLRLPRSEIRSTLGEEVEELYLTALGERDLPAAPLEEAHRTPVARRSLDQALAGSEPLLRVIQEMLNMELRRLRRGEQVARMRLTLELERGGEHREELRAAYPTGRCELLVRLLRLRLEARRLELPVVSIVLELDVRRARARQSMLFFEIEPQGDEQHDESLPADLRARFGDDAVGYLEPCERQLPEQRVRFVEQAKALAARVTQQDESVQEPQSAQQDESVQVVRRAFVVPQRLNRRLLPPGTLSGPYALSCNWWGNSERRLYYYLVPESSGGEFSPTAVWLYYDLERACWMVQGTV